MSEIAVEGLDERCAEGRSGSRLGVALDERRRSAVCDRLEVVAPDVTDREDAPPARRVELSALRSERAQSVGLAGVPDDAVEVRCEAERVHEPFCALAARGPSRENRPGSP